MTPPATRQALLSVIDQGRAHMNFEQMVDRFPAEHYNSRPTNVPYSFWGLLEHVRICTELTLAYALAESFQPLRWPDEFWPSTDATATEQDWNQTLEAIRAALTKLRQVSANESIDLDAPCRHAGDHPEHTILSEFIDAIDHTAYHFGEFAILRRVMGLWPPDHE